MTCDEVREMLSEHLLGTLEGSRDVDVRRHLRGCASCRSEMRVLGEGLTTFARAAHDRRPPADLRDRVLTVLEEEWRDTPTTASQRRWPRLLAVAAAAVVLVASIGFGVGQTRRANHLAVNAASYTNLLRSLGGEDFRIGTLRAAGSQEISGNAVLYDAHTDQSWGLVIAHAPGMTGVAHATLSSPSGRTIKLFDLKFDAAGDASSWLVSTADLHSFGDLTVVGSDGTVLATARIRSA